MSNESLFYYPDGSGPADFSFPDYVPLFIDEAEFTNLATAADENLITACGGDQRCLFDSIQTGDVEVGSHNMFIFSF